MGSIEDAQELAALAADHRVQERAAVRPYNTAFLTAPGFIRAISPVHGEPVVFTPGELLPAWVADQLKAGRGNYDQTGTFVLADPLWASE